MEDKDIVNKVLELYNFKEVNPMQSLAINAGLLDEKNFVISAPTASGKTLCVEMKILKTLSERTGKVVYIVPLVALAQEKYDSFREKYGKLGYKVAISVGDLDSSDTWLVDYDLIVCTTEKLDSLIRHESAWIKNIGLIIVDEVHTLNDSSRGPTLEILLTRLREIIPRSQIAALSATISNAGDIAKWLGATLVVSDFRPIKLYEGIEYGSKIQFYDRDGYELSNLEPEAAILENTLNLKKQALFFVSTRRNAESLAEKLGKTTKSSLGRDEALQLEELASEIVNVLESPTRQCKKLADCIKTGVAFHHAGLLGKQKRIIESSFRSGLIKAIVATPTLALGVNLPAFRVIVRDAKRYYPGLGAVYIPVLDYKQFVGRAGRPQYDDFGESVLLARTEDEARELVDRYVMGQPENISSKLAIEPVLRMHTLALIASEFCKSEDSLLEFFSKTFYAHQYGDLSIIEENIFNILDSLTEWKFVIRKDGRLHATIIGKRISELYIDPFTAHEFIESLNKAIKGNVQSFSFLQAISNTMEMQPLLSVRTGELVELEEIMTKREGMLLQAVPDESELEYDEFMKSMKTAMMFESWIEEATEDQILTRFRVAPGEFYGRRKIADWLIYSLQEIAPLLGHKQILKDIRKLRVRMEYGIKDELMPLIKLKQVGRVRSRKLFKAGLKTLEDLRKASFERISSAVGRKVAQLIKEQLGEKIQKQTVLRKALIK